MPLDVNASELGCLLIRMPLDFNASGHADLLEMRASELECLWTPMHMNLDVAGLEWFLRCGCILTQMLLDLHASRLERLRT